MNDIGRELGPGAGDRYGRARTALARDRIELERAMQDLKAAARTHIPSWPHIGERPYAWLLGTFVMGLWLGWRRAGGREVEP